MPISIVLRRYHRWMYLPLAPQPSMTTSNLMPVQSGQKDFRHLFLLLYCVNDVLGKNQTYPNVDNVQTWIER